MALFGKDTRENQLKNEINSLQFRKNSVISAIQKEIDGLVNVRKNLFIEAATEAYTYWKDSAGKVQGMEEYWKKVKEVEESIEQQETKKQEMVNRYDEELNLLYKELQPVQCVAGGAVCPKCGAKIKDEDLFCEKCGTKVK